MLVHRRLEPLHHSEYLVGGFASGVGLVFIEPVVFQFGRAQKVLPQCFVYLFELAKHRLSGRYSAIRLRLPSLGGGCVGSTRLLRRGSEQGVASARIQGRSVPNRVPRVNLSDDLLDQFGGWRRRQKGSPVQTGTRASLRVAR